MLAGSLVFDKIIRDRLMSTRHSPVLFLTRYTSSLLRISKAGKILFLDSSTVVPPKTRGRAWAAALRTRKPGSWHRDNTTGKIISWTVARGIESFSPAPPNSASRLAAVIRSSSISASSGVGCCCCCSDLFFFFDGGVCWANRRGMGNITEATSSRLIWKASPASESDADRRTSTSTSVINACKC